MRDQSDILYQAEDSVDQSGLRQYRRFTEVEDAISEIVLSSWWERTFPEAPVDVQVFRRSRSARFSAAQTRVDEDAAAVLIRDGSWDLVTVLHELAHIATVGIVAHSGSRLRQQALESDPHNAEYVGVLLLFWQEWAGFHNYGAFRSVLDVHGVAYHLPRRG